MRPSFLDFMLPLLVQGIAMATFFLAMITILLDGVPPQRIPLASGLSNFARITGGGFAASIVTTLWDRREALHQSRLADQTTIFTPGLPGGGGASASASACPTGERQAAVARTMIEPGLSAGGRRHLLGLGLDLPGADRDGLAVPAGCVGWRNPCGGGLDRTLSHD